MSLGTLFWPMDQDRIWAVIDAFIEKNQPFLLSHASPFQKFPDEMKKKIADSGIAMELAWSLQEMILAHPVTGWFITHGGWNSMQEAFMHRVPLYVFPATCFHVHFSILNLGHIQDFLAFPSRSTLQQYASG